MKLRYPKKSSKLLSLSLYFLTISLQAQPFSKSPVLRDLSEKSFRALSVQELQEMEKLGLSQIAKIKISQLKKSFSKTNWRILPIFPGGSGGSRMSGSNVVEEHLVVLSSLTLQYTIASGIEALALHEALGANGIEDEDYSVSMSLYTFLRCPLCRTHPLLNPEILKKINSAKTFLKNKEYLLAEGGTSVGGGGDGISTSVKTSLLQNLNMQDPNILSSFRKILKLNIQVDYSTHPPVMRLKQNSITLSYLAWIVVPEYKLQVINEITEGLEL